MRILLTSNAVHRPPKGGSTRSNLIWLQYLADQGHACRVISPALPGATEDRQEVNDAGLQIVLLRDYIRRAAVLTEEIKAFQPDWVLVSSEDVSHVLLRQAWRAAPDRLVYLAHTPQWYPFGPASWHPDDEATRIVSKACGVVAIGRHMRGYIREFAGIEAVIVHPPIYGQPPYRVCSSFDRGCVLMINPSQVKGITIFLQLAARFPHIEFAGLNGWGTTRDDVAAMGRLPNVRLLANVPDIDEALCQARLLLMPSLWYEGFGLIAMEAMLRGLPVISSDSGGLQEAKHGTGYIVAVKPIERYTAGFDDTLMPKAVVPDQDIEPWVAALQTLLTDRTAYEHEAARSRAQALSFVSRLRASDFADFLATLQRRPANLAEVQRQLLIERLRHSPRPR